MNLEETGKKREETEKWEEKRHHRVRQLKVYIHIYVHSYRRPVIGAPDKDDKFMIFVSLCPEPNPGQFCNALALIKEDSEATEELRAAAEGRYTGRNCTLEDACGYCEKEDGKAGPQQPDSCNKPLECPEEEAIPVPSGGGGAGGPQGPQGARRKRQGPGGPGGGGRPPRPQSMSQLDFDSEASFIKQLMNIPEEYRYTSKHTHNIDTGVHATLPERALATT